MATTWTPTPRPGAAQTAAGGQAVTGLPPCPACHFVRYWRGQHSYLVWTRCDGATRPGTGAAGRPWPAEQPADRAIDEAARLDALEQLPDGEVAGAA